MAWRIGDNGFDMRLSPHVPGVIKEMVRPWLCEQLSRHALSIEDVESWAIHPGGPRILTACADLLDSITPVWSRRNEYLPNYGNMSSPTVLFILERVAYAQVTVCRASCLRLGPG